MKRRLRLALEIAGALFLIGTLVLYGRALLRDDYLVFDWVKDEGSGSRARRVQVYACEGGYAINYITGLTEDRIPVERSLRHEVMRAGVMALHVPPVHFRYSSGDWVFVRGYPATDCRLHGLTAPRWAVPALGLIVMLLVLIPRGWGWLKRRRDLRHRGFPVSIA